MSKVAASAPQTIGNPFIGNQTVTIRYPVFIFSPPQSYTMCIRRQRRNMRSPSTEQKLFGPDDFLSARRWVNFLVTPDLVGHGEPELYVSTSTLGSIVLGQMEQI